MSVAYSWRGEVENAELNALHAEAFGTGTVTGASNWPLRLAQSSLGWVTARESERLVGFVNVIWDGFALAWIQDTMVSDGFRAQGIGTRLIRTVRGEAQRAGCEWLHVDFGHHLGNFYYRACGFTPTSAGLLRLD
jgi:GNAT superfamily N-acetyltransferase